MSQGTLRLLQAKFEGSGPCNTIPLEFRFGNKVLGSIVINQPGQYFSFPPSACKPINGTNFIRAYQNGVLKGSFNPGASAASAQTNVLRTATTGCYGPGVLYLHITVTSL